MLFKLSNPLKTLCMQDRRSLAKMTFILKVNKRHSLDFLMYHVVCRLWLLMLNAQTTCMQRSHMVAKIQTTLLKPETFILGIRKDWVKLWIVLSSSIPPVPSISTDIPLLEHRTHFAKGVENHVWKKEVRSKQMETTNEGSCGTT